MTDRQTNETSSPLNERMLKFFEFKHLPPSLQEVSRMYRILAHDLCATLPPGPERTVALRKLLESKDCAVRARLETQGLKPIKNS